MKKIYRYAIIIVILLTLLAANARATVVGELLEKADAGDLLDALPDTASELLDGGPGEDMDFTASLKKLTAKALEALKNQAGSILYCAVQTLAIAMVCTAAGAISGKASKVAGIAGCAAIAALALSDTGSAINKGVEIIQEISVFSKTLLPVLTASAVAAGNVSSSGAAYMTVMFAIDLITNIVADVMIPIVYVYIAVALAAAVTENDGLKAALDSVYKLISGAVKTVLALFVAFMAAKRILTNSTDILAVKTVKLVSGAVPVVGSVLGDAAETVIAGASAVKGIVGVFGIIGIAAICVAPVLSIAARCICFKASAIFIKIAGGEGMAVITEQLSKAFSLILALIGMCSLLMVIGIYMIVMGAAAV